MRLSLAALALAMASASLAAQGTESRIDRFMRDCDSFGRNDSERFCEVRTLRLPAGQRLYMDGGNNGGIHFVGWDSSAVLVRAMISGYADTRAEAQAIAREVKVETSGDRVYADGPPNRRHTGWYVTYEVLVPRRMNLEGRAHNGGVSVQGVEGRMDLSAVNGSVSVSEASGDIRAETTNGSVRAVLSGTTWKGNYLDLETTNGSVTLDIPRGYNAELETGTVNGGMNIDFPITVQGTVGRRITTRLGTGGPRVSARTTNGSVRIREIR